MDRFNLNHAKVLYLRFCAIYDHKFVKQYHDEDFKSLWAQEWCTGLSETNISVIRESLEYCKKNLSWPPSIAEFIKICESFSGVPSFQESLNLAVRGEFTHPVVLLAYEKIGNWSIRNDSEKQLSVKFKIAYEEALNKFREDSKSTWIKLDDYNAKPKELPPPSKIPTAGESKAFRECMTRCQEMLKSKTSSAGGKTYKHFDSKKIMKGHKEFEPEVYKEFCDYLLSISENETLILPVEYVYERTRLIGQREQRDYLLNAGYVPENHRIHKNDEPRRSNTGNPTKMNNSWTNY